MVTRSFTCLLRERSAAFSDSALDGWPTDCGSYREGREGRPSVSRSGRMLPLNFDETQEWRGDDLLK